MRFLAVAALWALPAVAAAQSSCTTNCHGAEAKAFQDCVHRGELSCVDCHGGNNKALRDKEKSHDPAAGYLGKPTRDKIPELCARCHADPVRMHAFGLKTDQLAHYRTSGHGKALFKKKNTNAAVCTDCHGSHHIRPAHDPRAPTSPANQPETCGRCHADKRLMDPLGLSTSVVADFAGSVHGKALLEEGLRGAPSCADCHGAHGATPPGVSEIVAVCGHCHKNTSEHYRHSPHFASDSMRCSACHDEKTAAYRGAGCTACHGAHGMQPPGAWMYQGDKVGQCGHCHRGDDDAATKASAAILAGTRGLADAIRRSADEILAAKEKGVFLENEKIYLRESARALVSVRPLAHGLDLAAIGEHLDAGLKRQDRAHELIEKRMTALRDRKILIVALALLLVLLAVLLRMKLKAIRELS